MIARLRGRLSESGGYTLSEMIVVLAILGIVVGALVQLFVSASNAQVDMSKRYEAQHNARLALDKIRREIHCANSVGGAVPGSSITITLGAYCPTNTTGTNQTVTWCVTGSTAPFALRRSTSACSPTSPKWADYLTTNQVFTAYLAPTRGGFWQSSKLYAANELVRPSDTAGTPYLFQVTVAGTSGTSEPIWPTTFAATVTGGATFRNIGSVWQASKPYAVNQYVWPTDTVANPYMFQVTAAGTSGASEPAWPATSGVAVTGGATFTNIRPLGLGQLSVDLPIDLTPANTKQRYELKDDIVLRNTTR